VIGDRPTRHASRVWHAASIESGFSSMGSASGAVRFGVGRRERFVHIEMQQQCPLKSRVEGEVRVASIY
jgi:hypothetical protein